MPVGEPKKGQIQREKERERRLCNGREGRSTVIHVEAVNASEETKEKKKKDYL
ncbi:MAG: hypothetical protein BYD32DRAFT_410639 [Podila humilis]|nr:MAG: hypothetical protein BYD32DRAFT_410639 [Podila humilis]